MFVPLEWTATYQRICLRLPADCFVGPTLTATIYSLKLVKTVTQVTLVSALPPPPPLSTQKWVSELGFGSRLGSKHASDIPIRSPAMSTQTIKMNAPFFTFRAKHGTKTAFHYPPVDYEFSNGFQLFFIALLIAIQHKVITAHFPQIPSIQEIYIQYKILSFLCLKINCLHHQTLNIIIIGRFRTLLHRLSAPEASAEVTILYPPPPDPSLPLFDPNHPDEFQLCNIWIPQPTVDRPSRHPAAKCGTIPKSEPAQLDAWKMLQLECWEHVNPGWNIRVKPERLCAGERTRRFRAARGGTFQFQATASVTARYGRLRYKCRAATKLHNKSVRNNLTIGRASRYGCKCHVNIDCDARWTRTIRINKRSDLNAMFWLWTGERRSDPTWWMIRAGRDFTSTVKRIIWCLSATVSSVSTSMVCPIRSTWTVTRRFIWKTASGFTCSSSPPLRRGGTPGHVRIRTSQAINLRTSWVTSPTW